MGRNTRGGSAGAVLDGEPGAATATAVLEAPEAARPAARPTLAELRLDQIAESPHNPRKTFNAAALEELAASIRASGIWEPLVVRPHSSGEGVYELASGHRRFRAAKLAGLEVVPATIHDLDEASFLELLTVANLQREDVHPLEEADAYAEMMKSLGWDVPKIAARVGKGETYVYDRLKFLTLSPEVRAIFMAGRITPAHATELSRLTLEQQAMALEPLGGGLWAHEGGLPDPAQENFDLQDGLADPYARLKVQTVRELKAWIQHHCRFDAAAADPVLFPEVVARVRAAEEAEVKVVHITREHRVHDDAKAEGQRTYGRDAWRRADGQEDPYLGVYGSRATPATCEHAVLGLVVSGPGRADAFDVCIARDKCRTHWGAEIRAKEKARAQGSSTEGQGAVTKPTEPSWEREERLREAKREAFKPARAAVIEALAAAIEKASFRAGGALEQLARDGSYSKEVTRRFPKLKTADDFVRRLAFERVVEIGDWSAYEVLPRFGKQLGVDVAAIVKAAQSKSAAAQASTAASGKATSTRSAKAQGAKPKKKARGAR